MRFSGIMSGIRAEPLQLWMHKTQVLSQRSNGVIRLKFGPMEMKWRDQVRGVASGCMGGRSESLYSQLIRYNKVWSAY